MADEKPKTSASKTSSSKKAFYVFANPGSTTGADGRAYGWPAFTPVEAPEGALDHVGGSKKHATKAAAEKAAAALKAKTQKK